MSYHRHSEVMRMIIDPNQVAIYMVGRAGVLSVERPSNISVREWEEFWSSPAFATEAPKVAGSKVGVEDNRKVSRR